MQLKRCGRLGVAVTPVLARGTQLAPATTLGVFEKILSVLLVFEKSVLSCVKSVFVFSVVFFINSELASFSLWSSLFC